MLLEMLLVIGITDGDTIKVLSEDKKPLTVRLASIDAPEKNQPYGQKSKQMLSDFIGGKKVTLDCPTKDRYKRLICTIYLPPKIDVNRAMVANGGAWVYRQYYKGTEYLKLEQEAKTYNLGLWKTSEYKAIEPWKWRRGER
ncbi:MAG: nuclease [Bacteroidetes bacterium]|nr:MAG: nuclease [Bacteroidota bacterium]